jgi:exosortase
MLEVHSRVLEIVQPKTRVQFPKNEPAGPFSASTMNSLLICATTQRANGSTLGQRASTLWVLSACIAAVLSQTLARLAQLAWNNDAYSHTFLILPLSCSLLFVGRKYIFARAEWAVAPALGVATPGVMLAIAGQLTQSLSLNIAALVVFWLACFLLCFGLVAFRKAAFPLLMLAFLIPLPIPAMAEIAAVLQRGSAEVAYRLLQIATVPVSRDGVTLTIPGLSLEIAAECSGLRSGLLLLITSLVIGHVHLHGAWRQLVLTLLVLPISILKNGIRVFTLATACVYVDRTILSSWLHHNGGFLFFLLALGLVMCAVKLLQCSEGQSQTPVQTVTVRAR